MGATPLKLDTYERFIQSDLHQNAIFKVLEIIGEAASRISDVTREAHPEIPWPNVVGLRNRMVHAYCEVDLDVIWNIVTGDIPGLIAELERIAPRGSE